MIPAYCDPIIFVVALFAQLTSAEYIFCTYDWILNGRPD